MENERKCNEDVWDTAMLGLEAVALKKRQVAELKKLRFSLEVAKMESLDMFRRETVNIICMLVEARKEV